MTGFRVGLIGLPEEDTALITLHLWEPREVLPQSMQISWNNQRMAVVYRWLTRALLLTVVSFCPWQSWAQVSAQTPGTSTIKVDSRLVMLDVTVRDGRGNAVLDLRKDEFRVYESNQPQPVRNFEPPSVHQMPAGAPRVIVNSSADLQKIGQAPITVLVLDELNMDFPDRSYARTKLIEWLARQPEVLAQPTAMLAVTYKDMHVVRDYTQNRNALLEALKKHTGDVVWRQDSTGRTGPQASENMFSTLGVLEQVAQATRGLPGRKNLIWVGDGFPAVSMSDAGNTSGDEIAAALRRLSNVMLEAHVTLSIVGPTLKFYQPLTIETQADSDMASAGNYDGMMIAHGGLQFSGLAAPTGGRAYANRNDLDGEIGESVAAGENYYTLAYVPTDGSNDPKKYRRIRVEVTRPGLTVQTRDGYFTRPPEPSEPVMPTTQQLAFDLYGAGLSTMQYIDLHVRAERVTSTDFAVHVDAGQMTWRQMPNGKRHAYMILLAVCLSPKQKLLSRTVQTLGSNTDASLENIGLATATLHMQVQPPPGTARIRFVVRDAVSGRVGTADFTP